MAKLMRVPRPTAVEKSIPINSRQILSPPETEVIFNLSCEPAYKYSLPAFADYGCDPAQRTSNQLQYKVLYIEAANKRYEISKEPSQSGKPDTYKLAEVLEPFVKDGEFMRNNSVPLSASNTIVRRHKKFG